MGSKLLYIYMQEGAGWVQIACTIAYVLWDTIYSLNRQWLVQIRSGELSSG